MLAVCSLVLAGLMTVPGMAQERLAKGQAKAIAEEAFGFRGAYDLWLRIAREPGAAAAFPRCSVFKARGRG
jgi:hypothetical protein